MKKFILGDSGKKLEKAKKDEFDSSKDTTADPVTPAVENVAPEDHADKIKTTSKMNGQKLIGAAAITEYFKKDFVALIAWKTAYGLPLKKEAGLPALYLSDLSAWLAEHEIDLPNLSTDYLRRFYDRKKQLEEIEAVPDAPLKNINAIVKITGRPAHIVLDWIKHYDDCPARKKNGVICCASARELRRWMDEKHIVTGRWPFSEQLDGRNL